LALEQRHLSHPQPVKVDQGEERLVARVIDGREEAPGFDLAEVARKALVGREVRRQRGAG
jgi:hypothetical protein